MGGLLYCLSPANIAGENIVFDARIIESCSRCEKAINAKPFITIRIIPEG